MAGQKLPYSENHGHPPDEERLRATADLQRLGQELHDGIGQELTGLSLLADALARRLQGGATVEADLSQRLARGLARVHDEVRNLARGLLPAPLAPEDLPAALEELAASTAAAAGLLCRCECAGPVAIRAAAAATHLYRIAQEAVSNALRHARARSINISLSSTPNAVTLSIRDDGVGLSADTPARWGLQSLRDRAAAMGAALQIGPAEGGGTQVTCTLPGRKPPC